MSYTTIHMCAKDQAFIERVQACVVQQAWINPELSQTVLGQAVQTSPGTGVEQLTWPTAIDYEAEYEFAVNNQNPNPGGDPGVITDANIEASVQTHWPDKPAPLAAPESEPKG